VVAPQSAEVEDDLVSIRSYYDSQQEERYARYMTDGSIVLHDKALSISRKRKRRAGDASSVPEQTVRIISYPSAGRSRSSQTIDRLTITVSSGRDTVDSMQPLYVTSLEERHHFTEGLSSHDDLPSNDHKNLPSSRNDAAPIVMATVELPILEHDIFTKFHRSNEAGSKSSLSLKRKMPLSFLHSSEFTNKDHNINSDPVSLAVTSSPEKEVADKDSSVKLKKKKGRPPIEQHRTKDAGESASASASAAGDKLRMTVDLIA